jgi:hypothetical protein
MASGTVPLVLILEQLASDAELALSRLGVIP